MADNSWDTPALQAQEYLGDGLYCGFDGWHVVLYASNGMETTNVVYLEPEVLRAFERYCARLRLEKESAPAGSEKQ